MTFDIFTNRTPFELLTDEERDALVDWEGPLVYWSHAAGRWLPRAHSDGPLCSLDICRAVARTIVDWSHLDKRFRFAAEDGNGDAFTYECRPEPIIPSRKWVYNSGDFRRINGVFASYCPSGLPWDQSLQERPADA